MQKITRRAVEESTQAMVKVGDTVRHLTFGRDAVVLETYTRIENGVRFNEILVEGPAGEWNPKDVRKL
jgi:hypothetical protein